MRPVDLADVGVDLLARDVKWTICSGDAQIGLVSRSVVLTDPARAFGYQGAERGYRVHWYG